MDVKFDVDELDLLIRKIVSEVHAIDWPEGRIALTEQEAANALGVARHVLRDARLQGHLHGRRIGKRVCYTREDVLRYVDSSGSGAAN